MSDKETVVQCEMRAGDRVHVAWIPKRFAVKGKVLRIDPIEGDLTVTAIYSSMDVSEANDRSQDHAHHREFSDA